MTDKIKARTPEDGEDWSISKRLYTTLKLCGIIIEKQYQND